MAVPIMEPFALSAESWKVIVIYIVKFDQILYDQRRFASFHAQK
jgi:hypothetical protein